MLKVLLRGVYKCPELSFKTHIGTGYNYSCLTNRKTGTAKTGLKSLACRFHSRKVLLQVVGFNHVLKI